MKKALYSLLAFATLLFAASCAKEPANVADPALGGKPVTTTFTVNMGGDLTKAAPVNSTLDDGTKVNTLYVGAYKDGALISTSKVDGSIPVENKKASVSLTLSKGVEYDLVFFAEVAGKYTVNFADGVATFAYPATVNANDPELDAFYKTMKFTPDGKNMTQDVVLTRPFAQLNVLVPNEKLPQDKTTDYVSTMTVKGVPTSFDLLGESPVAPAADASLTFAGAKIDAASFGNYASTAKWVGMNFILVPEAGTVDLTFNETDMPAPLDLTGIAVKTNGRTNLVGNIYGLGDYTFNVTVDEKFADEGETPIDANEVTYVIDDGQTYTAENPLVLDTDAVKSVSVTINGVDGSQITLSEVNANPVEAGKQVAVSSSNTDVATVALDGDAIKITPKANGDAVITIETPSFTKATYAAAVAKIYIQVTGMAVEPVDPELTVEGVPAEAVSEAFYLTVATNSTGEISWTVAPDGAATVAAGEKAGEYIVTPADNLTEDTPVTVTFTVAAVEGFNAASKEVKFTVKAAETPVEPEKGTVDNPYSVEDAVAAVADLTWTSNTEYEATEEVYVKGIISSIASEGTYGESGTFGNASFYISDDGASTGAQFYIYRALYFNNEKYTSGQDIKVGDTVVICGKLMNYKGNTPETVAGQAYLYSLEAAPAVESSISVSDMEVEVGKTKTIQPTVTPSNAVVEYTTTSSAISINGSVITGVSEGTATVTASIAAVEGSYTASSTTFTVTVTAAPTPVEGTTTITMTTADYVANNNCTVSAGSDVTCYTSLALDSNITVSTTGDPNCGSFWSTAKEWRLYQNKNGNVVITAADGCELVSVKLTFTAANGGTLLDATSSAIVSGEETKASGNSVTYTVANSGTATNGQIRITEFEISYK